MLDDWTSFVIDSWISTCGKHLYFTTQVQKGMQKCASMWTHLMFETPSYSVAFQAKFTSSHSWPNTHFKHELCMFLKSRLEYFWLVSTYQAEPNICCQNLVLFILLNSILARTKITIVIIGSKWYQVNNLLQGKNKNIVILSNYQGQEQTNYHN